MKPLTAEEQSARIIQKWAGHISIDAVLGLRQDIADALRERDNMRVRLTSLLPLVLGMLAFMTLQFGGPMPVIFGVLAVLAAVGNLFASKTL